MNDVSSDEHTFRMSVVCAAKEKALLGLSAFTAGLLCMGVVAHADPTFYTYQDGQLEERNALQLVSPSMASDRLRSRWPRAAIVARNRGPYPLESFSVALASATPEHRATALQHAHDTLTDLSGSSGVPDAETVEDVIRFKHALDIIQALGGADDEERLLQIGLAQGRNVGDPVHTLSAAFGSALRRNALETSPTLEAWQSRTGSPEFQANLTLALALWGYAPAHDRLIEIVATDRQASHINRFIRPQAFETITSREDPSVTELVRDILIAQSDWRSGAEYGPIEMVDGLDGQNVFADALLYAHAFFKGEDRLLINGPAAQLGYSWIINPMLPFLADPRQGALSLFATTQEGWDAASDLRNITRSEFLISFLCDLRAATDVAGDPAAMQDIINVYTAWHMDMFIPSVDLERLRRAQANLRLRYSLLDCAPQTVGFGDVDSNPRDVATSLPSYMRAAADPVWHLHDPYSDEPQFDYVVLDDLEDAEFQSLADDPNIAANPLWQEAVVRRGAVTAAHFAYPMSYSGGDDRRYFLKAGKETGLRDIFFGGMVDFRPRQTSSGTLFGIRLEIAPHVRNLGFAPVPSEINEQLDAALANGAFALVDGVHLRHGETSTALTYQRSSPDGTHVYVLSEPIDRMDNLIVDVDLAFYEASVTLSFPIYASPFGYQSLINTGKIEVQPWQ